MKKLFEDLGLDPKEALEELKGAGEEVKISEAGFLEGIATYKKKKKKKEEGGDTLVDCIAEDVKAK